MKVSITKRGKFINDYKVIRKLGEGAFAKVRLVQDQDCKLFAMKQMNKAILKSRRVSWKKSAYDLVLEELRVLKSLEHPNIIWLYEIIDDPSSNKDMYLITEYYSKGSIGDQLTKLNAREELHNKKCKKEGRIDDMRTSGLKPW